MYSTPCSEYIEEQMQIMEWTNCTIKLYIFKILQFPRPILIEYLLDSNTE